MNYLKIYDALIDKRKTNVLVTDYHIHHIIPLCIGGLDTVENTICLTPREHYIAHLLLAKAYPDSYKLQCCVQRLVNSNFGFRYNENIYDTVRKNRNKLCGIISSKNYKGKTIFRNIKTKQVKFLDVNDELVKSGLYVGINKGNKLNNTVSKNYIMAKDKNGNNVRVLKEDFYNSDEYVGINANKSGLWDTYNKLHNQQLWHEKLMFTSYKKKKLKNSSLLLFKNIFELYDYVINYFKTHTNRVSFDFSDMKSKFPQLFYKKVDKPLDSVLSYIKSGWNPNTDKVFLDNYNIFKKLENENENN